MYAAIFGECFVYTACPKKPSFFSCVCKFGLIIKIIFLFESTIHYATFKVWIIKIGWKTTKWLRSALGTSKKEKVEPKFHNFLLFLRVPTMVLTVEDRHAITVIYQEKGWTAERILQEFPARGWKRRTVRDLIAKIKETGSSDRREGSGLRLRTVLRFHPRAGNSWRIRSAVHPFSW